MMNDFEGQTSFKVTSDKQTPDTVWTCVLGQAFLSFIKSRRSAIGSVDSDSDMNIREWQFKLVIRK